MGNIEKQVSDIIGFVQSEKIKEGGGEFEESQGKSRNFFHGLEKFEFSRLTQGIF